MSEELIEDAEVEKIPEPVEIKYNIMPANTIHLENGASYTIPHSMTITQAIAMLEAFSNILTKELKAIEEKKSVEEKPSEEVQVEE